MAQKDSISLNMVREALQQCALAPTRQLALLQAVGIDPSLPQGRVSVQVYARLWRRLAVEADDEFFGMDRRPLRSGSLAYLARTGVAQSTLGEALGAMLGFLNLMLGDLSGHLQVHQGLARITLEGRCGEPLRPFACFTYWLIIHGLACWLADRRVPLQRAELRCAAPHYCADYQVLFCDDLRFCADQSQLVLAAECLDWPVRRDASEVQRFLTRAPGNILVRYRDPDSLAQRLRQDLFVAEASRWPEIEQVAQRLHMSVATLRRRLAEEGQTWQGLKDSVRKELALRWLADQRVLLDDVAQRLGFADSRSFFKAFRKWTGVSPGRYRRSLASGGGQNVHVD
jgi:AraC-like DNA-binding protein